MIEFVVGSLLFLAGSLADYVTTRRALRRGAREGNPIYGRHGERLWLFWPLDLAVYGALAWGWYAYQGEFVPILLSLFGVLRLIVAHHNARMAR